MSKWNCPLCKKNFSWEGKRKHLLSRSHEIDIAKAILVYKSFWVTWIANIERGQKLAFPPSVKISDSYYSICFPCKSLVSHSPGAKVLPCSCGQMDLQVKKIKEILALDLKVIEEVKKADTSALDKEIALLKRKNNSLEIGNRDNKVYVEFIDWCKEERPGLLEEAIGSNPQGWKKALAEITDIGLEEEEEED